MKCSLLALSSYLDDELDAGRRAEIEAHLVGCERCRKGLECLREETERFGALGRVHVPDDAVSGFLQQLGLLGPGESLPPRAPRPPDPPGPDLPRWMGGGGAAETLPWSARHDFPPPPPLPPPESDQPSLPFLDVFSPSGLTVMALPAGELSGSEEFHLNGRSLPGAASPAAPEPVPGSSEQRVRDGWPGGSVALSGFSTRWAGSMAPLVAAGVEAATPASAGIEAAAPPSARIAAAARTLAVTEPRAEDPAGVGAEVEPAVSAVTVPPPDVEDTASSYTGHDAAGSGTGEFDPAAPPHAGIEAIAPSHAETDSTTTTPSYPGIEAVAPPRAETDSASTSYPGTEAVATPHAEIDSASPSYAGIDSGAPAVMEFEAVAPASTEIEAAAPRSSEYEAAAPSWAPEPLVVAEAFPLSEPPTPLAASPVSLAPPDNPGSPPDLPSSPPPPPAVPPSPDIPMWPQMPAPLPGDRTWHVAPPPPPRPRASDDDGDPWSWAPRDAPQSPQPSTHEAPTGPAGPDPSAPDAAATPPGHGPGAEVAAAGQGAYEDATPDPLIDPLIARVNRPPQPVRATLISRLRDQVSLRLALMRHADESDERGSDATGAARHRAAHPPESAGPLSAALRARMDPHTGVDASTLPPAAGAVPARAVTGSGRPPTGPWVAAPPGTGATSGRGVRGAERGPAGPWTVGPPVRSATIAEEIPDSSDRQRVRDLDRGPRKPGRHTRQLGDRRWIGPSAGTLAPSSGRFGDLTHRVRHLAANTQRRYAALAILAILVVLVVTASLVLAHAGGQTLPLAGTGPTSHPAPAASATPALQSLPATVLQPSASVAPSVAPTVSATPVPTSVPTPVVATQTYGGAGTGWQLEDVRCCDVQAGTGYTRIVFDLGGASGADPTATVSFPTATTMVVTFTGVSAATSIEGDSGGGAVTGVNRESGSHVTFQLSLSHAVTIKGWDYFGGTDAESSAPLHLYFDLG